MEKEGAGSSSFSKIFPKNHFDPHCIISYDGFTFHLKVKFPPADLFTRFIFIKLTYLWFNISFLCFWPLHLLHPFSVEKPDFFSVTTRRGNAIFNNPSPLQMEVSTWRKKIHWFPKSSSSRAYRIRGIDDTTALKRKKIKRKLKSCLLHRVLLRIRENPDLHIPFSPPTATKPLCLSQNKLPTTALQ